MMLLRSFAVLLLGPVAAVHALTYKGVDWSSTLMLENSGKTFKTSSGATQPFEKILKSSGVNTVRQRLWVNPSDGVYNLDYNIKLGKRAVAAGLNVYLDLHYSDTWADPAHQTTPKGWPSNINDLAWEVYNYTLASCNSFQSNGIPLSIISIGNEITDGMLFPLGKSANAYNFARLLHSASSGVKDSNLSPKPKIMVHTDNGWNWETQKWFYTLILNQGVFLNTDFDMIGLSYYPFYNANAQLANIKSSMVNIANTFKKQVVIAETNWPVSCSNPLYPFPSDTSSIAKSVDGQTSWMKTVAAAVAAVPSSLGAGIFYWEPGWVGNGGLGSSCADNLMVENNGNARSSFSVFGSI
ncbi:hypothetical protein HYALB_00005898 [Hymenoscyphus albidus]|uniref:Arabinogalactan endo-beta-1,4-galactanase n=1 Tax=Hymenoscyphus albidus TaxID=595503 RepID=A0A9N9LRV0_9HELO|nr:hypothetical protein HYALB_00005898 [Hymenoscyphus albidus]